MALLLPPSLLKPPITLAGFYNTILAPKGISFPIHLGPVATALADYRIQKLMLIIGPGSGKSLLLSVIYPTYILGLDPTHTIIDVSASEGLAQGFVQATMEIIDKSAHYKRLFPNTRPDKKAGWSLERGIYTTARLPGDPDSSYRAAGLTSKQLVGKHAKLMILDDIHDQENSNSMGACEKVIGSYYQNLLGRADPQGARFLLAGRRWSEWDIYGHLIESEDWVAMRLPAERGVGETNLFYDVYVPPKLECCFTEGAAREVKSFNPKYRQFAAYYGIDPLCQGFYWPSSEHKRKEYFSVKRNRPAEAAAVYQGQPGGRLSGIFLESDFRLLSLGTFDRLTPSLIPPSLLPPGSRIVQGWDVAHTQSANADFSVCVTAILIPCREWHNGERPQAVGEADSHYDVLVVDVFKAKLEFGGLVGKIRELAQEWSPSFIPMEKNTGSIPIIQSLANMVPINPMSLRNMSKKARATIAISAGTASVQGWLRQGRVKFWEEAPWLHDLKTEMLDFTGDQTGHDDTVDAMIYTITQAILLGAGVAMLPTSDLNPTTPTSDLQASITESLSLRNSGFALINEIAKSQTSDLRLSEISPRASQTQSGALIPTYAPEIQLCKNCRYRDTLTSMCIVQNRRVVSLDSCPSWAWDGMQ